MAVDALASSHPLTSNESEVNTPSEISGLFDSITYSKVSAVPLPVHNDQCCITGVACSYDL